MENLENSKKYENFKKNIKIRKIFSKKTVFLTPIFVEIVDHTRGIKYVNI